MKKILITEPYPDFVISGLRKTGKVIHVLNPSAKAMEREIKDADILVVRSKTKIDKRLLDKAGKLRLVITATHGFEHVDVEELKRRKIRFFTTPAATIGMTEFVFGMIISLLRRIPEADRSIRKGKWERHGIEGKELFGKTLGVVGLGPIGKDVARIGRMLGMKIIACDPNNMITESELARMGIRLRTLSYVIKNADILTIHAHLNEKTYHMIGSRQISSMKRGSYIIHTARGGLVDENALLKAMKSGQIAGAALDVFEKEPLVNDSLKGLRNVVLTPHMGINTKESGERIGKMILDTVKKYG
ncbi:MAG: hydroxyacid dehydrogenase [Candidatus Aenigmarchaeota archaeon]|nr:hydroxyacid dehydrogenase [Candidatus Aenigmarchaeota archaeon]